jgi:hypothetical protein
VALELSFFLVLAAAPAVDGGAAAPSARPSPALLAPLPGPPVHPHDQYELHRAKDGTRDLLYEAPTFTARVARDGSVTFHDKKFGVTLLPLLFGTVPQSPDRGAPSLQSLIINHGRRAPQPPEEVEESTVRYGSRLPIPTTTQYRPDASEACQYPRSCFFDANVMIVSAMGTFDLTDQLMRLGGKDPYRYDKARFLAGTEEMRTRLAARAHADDLRDSTAALPGRLAAIRCDDRLTRAQRRGTLVWLRAELEPSTPEGRQAATLVDRALADLDAGEAAPPCPPQLP